MREFIFDQWGYQMEQEDSYSFFYENWYFRLEKTDYDEKHLQNLAAFCQSLSSQIPQHAEIVLNKHQHYISRMGNDDLVLISVPNIAPSWELLMKLQTIPFGNQTYTLTEMQELWEEKARLYQEQVVPSLRKIIPDDTLEAYLIYARYLLENAIQYLAEIRLDHSDVIPHLVLAHKRLSHWDAYSILNPLNMVLESRTRDLAELFKFGYVSVSSAVRVLKEYQIDTMEAELFFARVLFPTPFLDLCEEAFASHELRKKAILEEGKKLQNKMKDIVVLHQMLISTFSIRRISWL